MAFGPTYSLDENLSTAWCWKFALATKMKMRPNFRCRFVSAYTLLPVTQFLFKPTQMSAKDSRSLTSSSTRVQEFRQRLAEDFARVEGYVLTEENAEIKRVMAEQQVSKDVAVAGLVRMGLRAYRDSVQAEQKSRESTVCMGISPLQAFGANGGAVANSLSVSGQDFLTCTLSASNSALALPATSPSTDARSLSQFFRSRQEILNDPIGKQSQP